MTGKMCNETLGKLHFWLFLIGFHLTFDFMHIPGLLGMPRRIYTYEPGRGWDIWNLIVTVGVVFQALAILVFVVNLLWSYFKGRGRGKRSLGCVDAGVVHALRRRPYTTSPDSRGQEPPSAVGPEASGRSGLEVRIDDRVSSNEHDFVSHERA